MAPPDNKNSTQNQSWPRFVSGISFVSAVARHVRSTQTCSRNEVLKVGLEPTASLDATSDVPCSFMTCEPCRAARALQTGHSDWLELTSIDGDLQSVVAAWDRLPTALRKAILALVTLQE